MAATTPWTLSLEAIANGTAQPVDVPYTSSFDYFRNMQGYRDAEALRLAEEARQRELAAAEFAAAGSVEDRSKELIKNMYGAYNGEFGGRVLTPDEIQFGYVNALGEYVEGRPTLAQLGMTEERAQQIRYRNLSHDWYNAGMDHFEQPFELTNEWDISDNVGVYGNPEWMNAASAYLRANNGGNPTISPWINTFQHDRIGTYNLIKDADYNAFLGTFGRRQSNVDGYRDDSIAGWFKNAFAGKDQMANRSSAIRDLRIWNENGDNGVGLNKATDVMTKQYFDQLDLANKYGLTWEQAAAVIDSNGGATNGGGNGLNSGNGMLSNQDSSWQDVINRGGASLENWDSLLGQYTYDSPLNWAGMSDQEVEDSFGDLFDNGGMFTQGKNRDLIYAKLMENLGRV